MANLHQGVPRFLSTLSLRRATANTCTMRTGMSNFYPRSPCGERRGAAGLMGNLYAISIHALLAESDFFTLYPMRFHSAFLSTLSLRRATEIGNRLTRQAGISIHALLAESDMPVIRTLATILLFLSTLSLRRATILGGGFIAHTRISIHALLAESDSLAFVHFHRLTEFLSTLSLRRATQPAG